MKNNHKKTLVDGFSLNSSNKQTGGQFDEYDVKNTFKH